MQVGSCWFDRERGLLVEQARNESWHLPRAELQVLSLLVEHQGKLVSKHELKTGSGGLIVTAHIRPALALRDFRHCWLYGVGGQSGTYQCAGGDGA